MDIDLARISILDANDTACHELAALIQSAGWRVQCFDSAQEFLAQPRVLTPSCLILDVMLSDMSGLELQKRLAQRSELPIIFCTDKREVWTSVQAMKAGAFDVLIKPICTEVILSAIRSAIQRSAAAISLEASLQVVRTRYELLSAREREVMALVVSGRLNKLIAADLDISVITVKAHRGRVMRKMRARSLPHLVVMAAKLAEGIDQTTPVLAQINPFANAMSFPALNGLFRPRGIEAAMNAGALA
jgi:FixJ family two-component response regulator